MTRNLTVFSLIVLACLIYDSAPGQSDEVNRDQGLEFLNQRVESWKKYFDDPMFRSGRYVEKMGQGSMSIHYGLDNALLIQSSKPFESIETIYNLEYAATIAINKSGTSLLSYGQLSKGKSMFPGRELNPVFYTSILLRRFPIPDEIEASNLSVTKFSQTPSGTVVVLEPGEDLSGRIGSATKISDIELTFRPEIPIPVSLKYDTETVMNEKTNRVSTKISLGDFIEKKGILISGNLAMEINQDNQVGKSSGSIEVFPDEPLDASRCQLAYYGLKPNLVADLAPRRKLWPYSVIIGFGLLFGLIWFKYRR